MATTPPANLGKVAGLSLPPWGPYSIGGRFAVIETGYDLSNLSLRVKDSILTGNIAVRTSGARPRLDVALVTRKLQLDDFDTGDWSPTAESDDKAAGQPPGPVINDDELAFLLSPDVMGSLDAHLTLNIEQVLSGDDMLGQGSLVATLEDGRLSLAPIHIAIPGGSIDFGLTVMPSETDVAFSMVANIDQLDYGILARRIDPKSDVQGWISADVDLVSRAQALDDIMANANGHFDFAIWPDGLEAEIFDLWAIGLITNLFSILDSNSQSSFNCVIGRFDLKDGIMEPDLIYIDTTSVTVGGTGKVDFKTEAVDLLFVPDAKSPQFLSLETPITVDGTFDDLNVGVTTGDVFGTAIGLITGIVAFPFRIAFEDSTPEDGREACLDAMERKKAAGE